MTEVPIQPADARVAYFFTRFPHPTESFLQREIRAMRRLGLEPLLFSFHGGASEFDGAPVRKFSKWRLLALFWCIPREWWRSPAALTGIARLLFSTWPRDWLNHWENLYGAGIGIVVAARLRRDGVQHVHAAWASLPAMAAWVVTACNGISFSMGAHAYDLFEHGGDWLLREKCTAARFVHTSTAAGKRRLIALGVPAEKVGFVRRGLDVFPPCRPLRSHRDPLRIVCIARLVEKKGLLHQLSIYRALRDAGVVFEARLLGDGPLRARLEAEIRASKLEASVRLEGHVSQRQVWEALALCDVLVHTGVVTPTGDRDGLPNVVPEAMAAGVIAVTAPAEGVLEAVEQGVTGVVCPLDRVDHWVAAFRRIRDDDGFAERVRVAARRWVEENFDATGNASRVLERLLQCLEHPLEAFTVTGSGGEDGTHVVL